MTKNINSRRILKEINESKRDRKKTSLYLSERVYIEFKRAVSKEGQTPSQVIEKLMVDFIKGIS